MPANLQDRADVVRQKVEVLNGAESIGLLEYLILCLNRDNNFIKACEEWIIAREEK
jgi:hypothetical protein